MSELEYKESWVPKNWRFWTVVLEKTLESPLDCKKTKPVHPKGNKSWIFNGRTDTEAETLILWPPDVKNGLTGKDPGKDWRQEGKGTEDNMVGWHHWLDGHEFEQLQELVGEGQGGLACCSPWGLKVRHNWVTELTDWYLVCACMLSRFSCVGLFVTPWTVIGQAPLLMGFYRQEYWSGLTYPPPGGLPDSRIEPTSLIDRQVLLPLAPPGICITIYFIFIYIIYKYRLYIIDISIYNINILFIYYIYIKHKSYHFTHVKCTVQWH